MKLTGFSTRYDELQAAALAAGVCPKVTMAWSLAMMRACSRPLVPGAQWCARHRR